jgi:hypothetical protein
MTTPVQRLRASKIKFMRVSWDVGRKAGREWAERSASYGELLLISEAEQFVAGHCKNAIPTMSEILDHAGSRPLEKMLEEVFGPEYLDVADNDEYVGGFLTGAGEFFEKVKDEL